MTDLCLGYHKLMIESRKAMSQLDDYMVAKVIEKQNLIEDLNRRKQEMENERKARELQAQEDAKKQQQASQQKAAPVPQQPSHYPSQFDMGGQGLGLGQHGTGSNMGMNFWGGSNFGNPNINPNQPPIPFHGSGGGYGAPQGPPIQHWGAPPGGFGNKPQNQYANPFMNPQYPPWYQPGNQNKGPW